MKRFLVLLITCTVTIFLALLMTSQSRAQGSNHDWTKPYQLSSQSGQVGDEIILSDSYGYVHLIWPETGHLEHQTSLYYSQFDGENWTLPVDILIGPAATNIAAAVDLEGYLHLVFTNGGNGDVYYTRAFIQDATSAKGWQLPRRLEFSAKSIAFKVDSIGNYHLLYSGFSRNEPGVYYTSSVDNGESWSRSVWLDSDIPSDLTPSKVQLEIGDENSLHATWFYWDQEFLGRWIRYSNSFDQGRTWSTPFTIDRAEAGSDELRLPSPSMAVMGSDVHLIWAGDQQTHRKHRVSHDSGHTWSEAKFILGDLLGQAIGDGLAVDALGRLHFFGQIRYPQGIYQAYWSQGRWSTPHLIYLIAQDAFEPFGERIHSHRVRAAVRAGNQLVVTFTTSPNDPRSILYVMHMTMSDVPALELLPLANQKVLQTTVSELNLAAPTPSPEITSTTLVLNTALDTDPSGITTPANSLFWGVIPAVLLLAVIIAVRFLIKRNNY